MAADIIEAPIYEAVPEVVPVEVGSAWYLRGDVSYDFKSDFDGDYRTFNADPCEGCGTGYGKASYDDWEIEEGVDFGAGFGYQFTDDFRGDLTAHYWEHDVSGKDEGEDCFGLCGSEEDGKAKAWELMANAYVDVGTFAGITPYVGAGLGGVHVKYEDFDSTTYDGAGAIIETNLPGEESWRFAYALMAGASYDLTKSLKIDVGYRYVNVEDGDMFGFDEFTADAGASGAQGTDNGFDRHTIQAGIRYSLF